MDRLVALSNDLDRCRRSTTPSAGGWSATSRRSRTWTSWAPPWRWPKPPRRTLRSPLTWTPEHLAAATERSRARRRRCATTPSALSLCTGWSRGYAALHIARNADALGRLRRALNGADVTMYAAEDARDAEIDAGARRSVADLAEDVRLTAERLAPEIAKIGPWARGPDGRADAGWRADPRRARALHAPAQLVYHHVDLDAGYTFEQVDPDLVALFLDDAVARLGSDEDAPALTITTDEGDHHLVGGGGVSVTGSRAGVLPGCCAGRRRPL